MNLKRVLLGLPMILIAILNGGLREAVWNKYLNELAAHQVSTISLILFCSLYVGLIFRFLRLQSARQALAMGFVWVALTVGFEFGFGPAMGNTWQELFADYNLTTGCL